MGSVGTRGTRRGAAKPEAAQLLACVLLVAGAAACGDRAPSHGADMHDDSAFAGVQERGRGVMGVDQYTSHHVFEDLPDGGRIVLDRDDPADTAAIATIRAHMREVAADFVAGNFTKPFAVHATQVPGTAVMAEHRDRIVYSVSDRPAGAEVRIRTSSPAAITAIHAFLEFQRRDHRTAGH